MTYGRITTKGGKNTLVGHYEDEHDGFFRFIADEVSTRYNWYLTSDWDFEEIKPSAYEIIKGMKSGTMFKASWGTRYIKLLGDSIWSADKKYGFILDPKDFGDTEITVVDE